MFRFAPVTSSQKALLYQWFEQEHIAKWMHGVGLQNTLDGLDKFFQKATSTTYWVGYDNEIPFAFLITSPEGNDAICLDVFICEVAYLGKGLAVSMIREFLTKHFSHMRRILIDPEATNERAIHVYKKLGFKVIGEFIASWHPVPHLQMEMIMDISSQISFPDFLKVDMRVGTIIAVTDYPEAKKPAYKLEIDFGPLGKKRSSAQITQYKKEELVGKQVIGVVNFPPKQIGKFSSEVLTLGIPDEHGHVILLEPTKKVPNGGRVF